MSEEKLSGQDPESKKADEKLKKTNSRTGIIILGALFTLVISFILVLKAFAEIKLENILQWQILPLPVFATCLVVIIAALHSRMEAVKDANKKIDGYREKHKVDQLFIVIASSLLAGFLIYVAIVYLQPDSLFTSPPESQWWSALSVLIALLLATLAIIYNYRKDVLEKTEEIKDLYSKIEAVNKNIEKAKDEAKLSDTNLYTKTTRILSLLTDSYNIEIGTIEKTATDILKDLYQMINGDQIDDKLKGENKILSEDFKKEYANSVVNISVLFWQKLPLLGKNEDSYLMIKNIIIRIRELACLLCPNETKLELYHAFAVVEMNQITEMNDLKINSNDLKVVQDMKWTEAQTERLEKIRKVEENLVNIIEQHNKKPHNEDYKYNSNYAKSIQVKMLMKEGNYIVAQKIINVIIKEKDFKDSNWDKISYLLCNFLSTKTKEEMNRLNDEHRKNEEKRDEDYYINFLNSDKIGKLEYDREGYKPMVDLIWCYEESIKTPPTVNDDAKKKFFANFFVLNTQFYSHVSSYERYSFFNTYDELKKRFSNYPDIIDDLLKMYLIYYSFWGDSDASANRELNKSDTVERLEHFLMDNVYPNQAKAETESQQ